MSNFEVIEEVVYLSGEDETEVMVFVFSVSRVWFFRVKNQKEESLPKSPVYLDTTPSESEKSDITGKSVPILIGEASSLGIKMIAGLVPFINFTL